MSDCKELKPISRKELETYLRIKKFIGRNGYEEADLRNMVRAREPTHTPLIIHSDDMESKRYECLSDTANGIKVSKQTLIYVYENKRPLVTGRKGGVKVFYIKQLEDPLSSYLSQLDKYYLITTSERNQEAALYLQELTSTLPSQRLSQVHLLGSTSHDYQEHPQFLSICKSS